MDWYLDGDGSSVSLLRREVAAYLRRHAEPGSDVDAAELVFSEAVGNAVRHAGAPVWVSLTWHDVEPTLTVYDAGPGLDPDQLDDPARTQAVGDPVAESGRGLFLIRELAPEVRARRRTAAGTVVEVRLPVRRSRALSHDPRRHRMGVLPALEEARPEGGFGKEAFLRALVVQLAQAVALQHGPDAADAAVAQVGIDVGSQMEAEFRAAERVVGRLGPEQLGRCYVRLKHAIDGGFHVVEATEDRVVLGNTRCPFGDAVKKAPALCRMTSSVFGGIAASNHPAGASVLLEERIAVGDPGCRVVVLLGETDPRSPHAHVYQAPGSSGD